MEDIIFYLDECFHTLNDHNMCNCLAEYVDDLDNRPMKLYRCSELKEYGINTTKFKQAVLLLKGAVIDVNEKVHKSLPSEFGVTYSRIRGCLTTRDDNTLGWTAGSVLQLTQENLNRLVSHGYITENEKIIVMAHIRLFGTYM